MPNVIFINEHRQTNLQEKYFLPLTALQNYQQQRQEKTKFFYFHATVLFIYIPFVSFWNSIYFQQWMKDNIIFLKLFKKRYNQIMNKNMLYMTAIILL